MNDEEWIKQAEGRLAASKEEFDCNTIYFIWFVMGLVALFALFGLWATT